MAAGGVQHDVAIAGLEARLGGNEGAALALFLELRVDVEAADEWPLELGPDVLASEGVAARRVVLKDLPVLFEGLLGVPRRLLVEIVLLSRVGRLQRKEGHDLLQIRFRLLANWGVGGQNHRVLLRAVTNYAGTELGTLAFQRRRPIAVDFAQGPAEQAAGLRTSANQPWNER